MNPFHYLFRPLSLWEQGTAFLIGFGIVFSIYSGCVNRQWDFPVYYLASHALYSHQNPYDPAVLQSLADSMEEVGYGGGLPYLYPPHLARLGYPFTKIPFFASAFLWMTLKCIALEFMLFLSLILLRIPLHPLSLLLAHGVAIFYRPIALDFNAGNIATLEAALILAGLTAWYLQRYAWAGGLTIAGCSLKGSSILILLYPLHLRDRNLLKTLIIFSVAFGFLIIMDWKALLQFISFFRSPMWNQIWDEQVQSFYNCSSVTVILRTFSETYFADPLINIPILSSILIPFFPVVVFLGMAYLIHRDQQRKDYCQTDGLILSLILCGILLLPPRLAGYTLIWTVYPIMQMGYFCWIHKKIHPFILLFIGVMLIQLNIPPNHIPPGITQILIDKDFFGLLFLFVTSTWLVFSRIKQSGNSKPYEFIE